MLEKPGDASRARAQLARLSGGSARFYTACAVIGRSAGVRTAHLDTTTVTFRVLSEAEIARYVARDAPYDCAGGFKAESLGITLMDSIDSVDPTALIGLPLIWLAGALRAAGLRCCPERARRRGLRSAARAGRAPRPAPAAAAC